MGDSGVRLAASQVIEHPAAEVFRFVATEHFEPPKWHSVPRDRVDRPAAHG